MSDEPAENGIAFERIADSFVARIRKGEHPSISLYVERFPEMADEILDLFPALAEMEGLKPELEDGTQSFSRDVEQLPAGFPLERLGDYRILRIVGRGGMGVVYEARRESLSAHFAVKVLSRRYQDDSRFLSRFRNEARSAARLHHTNIVPVFDFGEHNGILYYVMQYIPGQGLDKVLKDVRRLRGPTLVEQEPSAAADRLTRTIAERLLTGMHQATADNGSAVELTDRIANPSGASSADSSFDITGRSSLGAAPAGSGQGRYFREVARIGAQVADALSHAHSLGVLHRDIKPSNLLLDGRGNAWVADFGLAKSDEGEDLTEPGDVIGTLRYLAPERLDGKSDKRGDIYALGATLYEMLALRPPFDAPDRAQLLRLIMNEAPTPLRNIDRRVPRDLETIVHKAMAREVGSRYAAAGAMAEDLRRFLEGRPISARRSGPVERFWLACRRNPVPASMAAALFLVLLSAFIIVSAALVRARADRALADRRRLAALSAEYRAKNQSRRADAGFNQARAAVDRYLKNVSEDDTLTGTPKLSPLRRRLIESAAEFYRQFLQDRRDDPSLRKEIAAVTLKLVGLRRELDGKPYVDEGEQALDLYEKLAREFPEDPAVLSGRLAALYSAHKLPRAAAEADRLLAVRPDIPEIHADAAKIHRALSLRFDDEGDFIGAAEAAGRALEITAERLRGMPQDVEVERLRSSSISDIGVLFGRLQRGRELLPFHEIAFKRGLAAFSARPDRPRNLDDVAVELMNISLAQWELGLREQAALTEKIALSALRILNRSNPEIPRYADLRLRAADHGAALSVKLGKYDPAADDEAIETFLLSRRLPGFSGHDNWASAWSIDRRAAELSRNKNETELRIERLAKLGAEAAAEAFRLGALSRERLLSPDAYPNIRKSKAFQDLLRRIEKGEAPRPPLSESASLVSLLPANISPEKSPVDIDAESAFVRYGLGVILGDMFQLDRALEELGRARDEFAALIRKRPDALDSQLGLAKVEMMLGHHSRIAHRFPEAYAHWIAGRDLQLGVVRSPYEAWAAQARVALIDYAGNFASRGLWDDAERAFAPALERHKPPSAADEFLHALVALMRGDETGYRAIRDRARSRYEDSDPPIAAADVAMIASLRPDPSVDRGPLVELARRGHEMGSFDFKKVYLALALLRDGKLDEAALLLDEYDANNAFGLRGFDDITTLAAAVRALLHQAQNRPADARAALAVARNQNAELGARQLTRTQEYPALLLGWAEARVLIAEAASLIEARPERPDPWNALLGAWGETVAGGTAPARTALARLEASDLETPAVRAARGWILSALGDKPAALADFDASLKADPECYIARLGKGRLELAAGQSARAAEDLVHALAKLDDHRQDPFSPRAEIDRLIVSDDLAFRRALELRPDDRQLWVARARRFAWADRIADAAEAYRRGTDEAQPAEFWSEYASALILIGDREGYRRVCASAFAPKTQADDDFERLFTAARIASIDPNSGIPAERLKPIVSAVVAKLARGFWLNHLQGRVLLRSPGKERDASRMMIRANTEGRSWIGLGMNWYSLAIVNRKLKSEEDAERWARRGDAWLAECEKDAREADRIPPRFWINDYLEAKVLQQEFARLSASR